MAKTVDTRSFTEKMLCPDGQAKKNATGQIMSNSTWAQDPVLAKLPLHILNIALSGSLRGGLRRGALMVVGETQTFKSAYGAIIMGAYQQANPDAKILFFDSEFGTTLDYFKRFGGNPDNIIHIPIDNIDHMKHEVALRLLLQSQDVKAGKDRKVGIFIDSIGLLGSKKEIQDSLDSDDQKSDMTRAKSLNSFWRTVISLVNKLQVPMYVINHYYLATGGFGDPRVVSGGERGKLAVNDIWFISKSQFKEGTVLRGQYFTITIDKSRKVIKGSKFKINVRFDETMSPYTGLWEIAEELGFIYKPTARTAQPGYLDKETGEVKPFEGTTPKRFSEKNPIETSAFWEPLLEFEPFLDAVEDRYMYTSDTKMSAFNVDEEEDEKYLDLEEAQEKEDIKKIKKSMK